MRIALIIILYFYFINILIGASRLNSTSKEITLGQIPKNLYEIPDQSYEVIVLDPTEAVEEISSSWEDIMNNVESLRSNSTNPNDNSTRNNEFAQSSDKSTRPTVLASASALILMLILVNFSILK